MTPWVQRLLAANVAIFFGTAVLPALAQFESVLAFYPPYALTRPWTFVTYMFLHGGFGHLFLNMLGLFFFGPRVESRIGSGHFIRMYLASGIVGALASMVFSRQAWIIGASGGVFGVMYAFAHFWPREKIYIYGVLPVESRILVIGSTVLALVMGFTGGQRGTAHFAHLGGYGGAWLYLAVLGRAITAPRRDWEKRVNAAAGSVNVEALPAIDLDKVHPVNRDEVARIVEKAKASGVTSLTNQERTFLSHFTHAPG